MRDAEVDRLRSLVGEDTFSGRYEILRETGAGGMGRVFEAIDRESQQRVAIKVITNLQDRERFAAEADVLERLTHPNIVRYVRHGTTSEGDPYLAMEWLVGESLDKRLERGPLPLPETLRLGELIADALVHAHAHGIVHRDLKPSNIFLIEKTVEQAHLIDFGVAKLSDSDLTQTGQIIGTPGYMAPEQVRGERSVDARADLFALGCVLYECLTGKAPFEGAEVMEVLARLLLEAPRPLDEQLEDVPPRLAHLVDSLLSKDRAHRLGDAAIARDELQAIRAALVADDDRALERIPAHVPRPSKPDLTLRESPRSKRRRWWLVPVIVVPLGVAIGAAGYLMTGHGAASCEAGNGAACRARAAALHKGEGVAVDHEAARVLDARGCDAGFAESCAELGSSLLGVLKDAQPAPGDPRRARWTADMVAALDRGCELGAAIACRKLGREFSVLGGWLPHDVPRAFALVQRGCQRVDEASCKALGDMAADPRNPEPQRTAARNVLDEVCAAHHLRACK